MTDYGKAKKRLKSLASEEYGKVLDYSEEIGDIRCNDNDIKVTSVVGFGAIAWAISMIAMPFIVGTGALPAGLIQPLFVAVPGAVGIGSSIAIRKKLENDERLRKRTNARTQTDRIVAATKLEVKQEKHRTHMYVLTDTVRGLEKQESLGAEAPASYLKTTIAEDTRTKEEIEESINAIEKNIQEKLKELDVTTTKKTLKERFWRIRDKHQKLFDLSLIALLSVIAGAFVYNIPLMAMNGANSVYTVSTSFLQIIAPGLVTGAAATAFAAKFKHDEAKAFNKLNEELLGEEALSETTEDNFRNRKNPNNRIERYDLDLCRQSGELVSLYTFLEEEKDRKEAKYGEGSGAQQETNLTKSKANEVHQPTLEELLAQHAHIEEEVQPTHDVEDRGIAFTKKDRRK